MTPEERLRFKEAYKQSQVGYRLLQVERDRQIRATNTVEAIAVLRPAFAMAAKLPPRPSSGLVEFYAALSGRK